MDGLDYYDFPYGSGAPKKPTHIGKQHFHVLMNERMDEYMASERANTNDPTRSGIIDDLLMRMRGSFKRQGGDGVWLPVTEAEARAQVSKELSEVARQYRIRRQRALVGGSTIEEFEGQEATRRQDAREEYERRETVTQHEATMIQEAARQEEARQEAARQEEARQEAARQAARQEAAQWQGFGVYTSARRQESVAVAGMPFSRQHYNDSFHQMGQMGGFSKKRKPSWGLDNDLISPEQLKGVFDDPPPPDVVTTSPDSSLTNRSNQCCNHVDTGTNGVQPHRCLPVEGICSTKQTNAVDSLLPPLPLVRCHVESALLQVQSDTSSGIDCKSFSAVLQCKCLHPNCLRTFPISQYYDTIACPWCPGTIASENPGVAHGGGNGRGGGFGWQSGYSGGGPSTGGLPPGTGGASFGPPTQGNNGGNYNVFQNALAASFGQPRSLQHHSGNRTDSGGSHVMMDPPGKRLEELTKTETECTPDTKADLSPQEHELAKLFDLSCKVEGVPGEEEGLSRANYGGNRAAVAAITPGNTRIDQATGRTGKSSHFVPMKGSPHDSASGSAARMQAHSEGEAQTGNIDYYATTDGLVDSVAKDFGTMKTIADLPVPSGEGSLLVSAAFLGRSFRQKVEQGETLRSTVRFPSTRTAITSALSAISTASESVFTRTETTEVLTLFQAAPLVYQDVNGDFHPIDMPDSAMERAALKDALADTLTDLDVVFDFATPNRLGEFLSEGLGNVLHYSGHCSPGHLALEDGWGAMYCLAIEDLADWIQNSEGNNLQLVFLAASHSRTAGDAIVMAGVNHVVCCRTDEDMVRDDVTMEFTRAFYQVLANGGTISQAFDSGCSCVKKCHFLEHSLASKEVEKFVLLPEDKEHHDMVFDPEPPPSVAQYSADELNLLSGTNRGTLLSPLDDLEGREVDIHNVLSELRRNRIVRVTGPEGVGKCSVAKGVCHYMQDRQHMFKDVMDCVLWLTVNAETGEVESSPSPDDDDKEANTSDSSREMLLHKLLETKTLLILDARYNAKEGAEQKLNAADLLMRDVIAFTDARTIIIESNNRAVRIPPRAPQAQVRVDPLGYLATVRLFGKLCPHVQQSGLSTTDFQTLIVPEDQFDNALPDSKIGQHLYHLLGDGYPTIVRERAVSVTTDEYDNLLQLAQEHIEIQKWKQELDVQTRTDLDEIIGQLLMKDNDAIVREDYEQAKQCKARLTELEVFKEKLPDMPSLQQEAEEVEAALSRAPEERDNAEADELKVKLVDLTVKIQNEKLASRSSLRLKRLSSQVGMEARVEEMEKEYKEAIAHDDFDKAENLQQELKQAKGTRASKPSIERLKEVTAQRLEEYTIAKNYALNNSVDCNLEELRELHEVFLAAYDRETEETETQRQANLSSDSEEEQESSEGRNSDRVETRRSRFQRDEQLVKPILEDESETHLQREHAKRGFQPNSGKLADFPDLDTTPRHSPSHSSDEEEQKGVGNNLHTADCPYGRGRPIDHEGRAFTNRLIEKETVRYHQAPKRGQVRKEIIAGVLQAMAAKEGRIKRIGADGRWHAVPQEERKILANMFYETRKRGDTPPRGRTDVANQAPSPQSLTEKGEPDTYSSIATATTKSLSDLFHQGDI